MHPKALKKKLIVHSTSFFMKIQIPKMLFTFKPYNPSPKKRFDPFLKEKS